MPPLPGPALRLEVEDDGVFAGIQFGPFPHRALEIEQVVEEHHLAPPYPEITLAQEEAIAAETPAVSDHHAFCAALGISTSAVMV